MVMRSRRESYDGDDDFGGGMDDPVPNYEPPPPPGEADPTANAPPPDQGKVQDNDDFRGLDRETQKWIEAQSDPFAALAKVMGGGGPKGGGGGGEQPAPEAPSTPPGPATPGPGPGGGGAPDFVSTPNETGQTFESSFAQPGTAGARPFMGSERLNLFRSLPQFRELARAREAGGGMRFSPEMSVGGGVGGNIATDFGSLSSAFGQGRPGEEDFRRRMMGRMYGG